MFDDLSPDEQAVLAIVLWHYRVDRSHGRTWVEVLPRIDAVRYSYPIPLPRQTAAPEPPPPPPPPAPAPEKPEPPAEPGRGRPAR